MAKVFLDTNTFIDSVHRHPQTEVLSQLENHIPFISPLSIHIYCYTYRVKIPNQLVSRQLEMFSSVDLTDAIISNACKGPTNDLEDNIQLHSAAEAACDFFLTSDKRLLTLGFFGKTRITNRL